MARETRRGIRGRDVRNRVDAHIKREDSTELGWSPRFPTHDEGLRQVVDAWKAEGFPPKS